MESKVETMIFNLSCELAEKARETWEAKEALQKAIQVISKKNGWRVSSRVNAFVDDLATGRYDAKEDPACMQVCMRTAAENIISCFVNKSDEQDLERDLLDWLSIDGRSFVDENGVLHIMIPKDSEYDIDYETAAHIVFAGDPKRAFLDKLKEWYEPVGNKYLKNTIDAALRHFKEIRSNLEEDTIRAFINRIAVYDYPENEYLNKEYRVPVIMDTGDMARDFAANDLYGRYQPKSKLKLHDESALIWLAKQQGYDKSSIMKVFSNTDDDEETQEDLYFLMSLKKEAEKYIKEATLTFAVRMTLRDLISVNEYIRNTKCNTGIASRRRDPGYIVVDRTVRCGLFSHIYAGDCGFGIELENDVKIPVKYIFSCLPEGYCRSFSKQRTCEVLQKGCNVGTICMLSDKDWRYGRVKAIHLEDSGKETS